MSNNLGFDEIKYYKYIFIRKLMMTVLTFGTVYRRVLYGTFRFFFFPVSVPSSF